jgi:hypothetical protein
VRKWAGPGTDKIIDLILKASGHLDTALLSVKMARYGNIDGPLTEEERRDFYGRAVDRLTEAQIAMKGAQLEASERAQAIRPLPKGGGDRKV